MEFALTTATSVLNPQTHVSSSCSTTRCPTSNQRSILIYNNTRTNNPTHYPSKSSCVSSSIVSQPWSLCGGAGLRRGSVAVLKPSSSVSVRCISPSAAESFTFGGGSGGTGSSGGRGEGGDDSGGRSGGEGNKANNAVAAGAEEVSGVMPDVIVLNVEGMMCGGCVASVKRILESQPQVSSASVDLTTETAVIWPISEAKVIPNWQKELGEALAKHLTTCGFKSNLRGTNSSTLFQREMEENQNRLNKSVKNSSWKYKPYDGTLTIEVRRAGGETSMGEIVSWVEAAQSRKALVQRLAGKVLSSLIN